MAISMLPSSELLPAVLPTDRLGTKGVARPNLRARYRKIPDARNAVSVVLALLQTVGVVVAAGVVHTWWAYLAAFVVSGWKNLRALGHAAAKGAPSPGRTEARQVIAVQAVLFAGAVAWGRPLLYPVCWLGSWMSLWKFSNRLRAIAEHGGMARSDDRRLTTHHVRQRPLARLLMVPYNTGWHLAHHVDIAVPFRNLPAFHAELVRSGWVVPDLEYG